MGERFTYSLSGKVLPERAVVNLPLVVRVLASGKGKMPEDWDVVVSVVNSQIAATLTTASKIEDVEDMRERVEAVVRHCVDALGFLLACGYDVELTQVTAPDILGHIVFGVDVRGVREKDDYTNAEILAGFQAIMQLGPDKQPWIRRALVDFREAIRSHEDAPFFSFRAIEDLRQRFVAGEDTDVKRTWGEMAVALELSNDVKEYVWKELRPLAISIRHGTSAAVSRESRTKMLRVTWDLINRFVKAPLPEPNHPLQPTANSAAAERRR